MRSLVLKSYLFILIIFSGFGIPFFRESIASIILLGVSILLIFSNTIVFKKKLLLVILFWSIYSFLTMILYSDIFLGFYSRYMAIILSTYIIITYFKQNFFFYFEKYIYFLSFISLFFFFWQIIDLNSMLSFFNTFDLANGLVEDRVIASKSILIYTLHRDSINFGMIRNCGFTWEPGPFSIFVLLAMYFNLLRTNQKIVGNFRFLVLSITLLTTVSTTGVLAGGLILLYVVWLNYSGIKRLFIFGSTLFVLVFIFYTSDFLFAKIFSLYSSGNAQDIIEHSQMTEMRKSLGRFAAFEIGWLDFVNNPILGYAGATRRSYLSTIDANVNQVSGLASIIGKFGLIGFSTIVIYLMKSSKRIAKIYHTRYILVLFLIMMVGLFSFHLEFMPIMVTIMFYSLFFDSYSIDNQPFIK